MRRSFFLIFVNAMILIVIFALMAQSLFIVTRLARAASVTGLVKVQRAGRGDFTPLAPGDFIKTNDVIRTEKDGEAEFAWADGTRLKIEPNSDLTVKKTSHNVAKKADESQFSLSRGTIFVRIVKTLAPQSRFEIETPTTTATVRGTIFMVKVANGQTEVAVHKGSVNVTSGEGETARRRLISPGQIATSQTVGDIKLGKGTTVQSEFADQESIIKPELMAQVRTLSDNERVLVQGRTEAGDNVTVNGHRVRVLGNGAFSYRTPVKRGENIFTIISTDKHGATNQIARSITLP